MKYIQIICIKYIQIMMQISRSSLNLVSPRGKKHLYQISVFDTNVSLFLLDSTFIDCHETSLTEQPTTPRAHFSDITIRSVNGYCTDQLKIFSYQCMYKIDIFILYFYSLNINLLILYIYEFGQYNISVISTYITQILKPIKSTSND